MFSEPQPAIMVIHIVRPPKEGAFLSFPVQKSSTEEHCLQEHLALPNTPVLVKHSCLN